MSLIWHKDHLWFHDSDTKGNTHNILHQFLTPVKEGIITTSLQYYYCQHQQLKKREFKPCNNKGKCLTSSSAIPARFQIWQETQPQVNPVTLFYLSLWGTFVLFSPSVEINSINRWILEIIANWNSTQFITLLPKKLPLPSLIGDQVQLSLLRKEIQSLLQLGALETVPFGHKERSFYLCYFLILKKDGHLHPILDLRKLNTYIQSFVSACYL